MHASEAHAPPAPTISVVIPHYNDLDNLDRCLALLAAQTFGGPYEIIVSDNASTVPLAEIEARVAGRARVVVCAERGAGPTRNAGFAVARADRLAFIDSDCRARPGWLAAGHAALDGFDFVGGQVEVDVDDPGNLTPVEAFERVFAFRFKEYIEKKKFSGTGNLFVRREVFDAVGGFKAQVSEDVEWSHRAGAAGFRLAYEPEAVVGHPARREWSDLRRKWDRMLDEGFALARTRRFGMLTWFLRSWAVLASALPHAITILTSPKLDRLRDRFRAIIVLIKIRFFRFWGANARLFRALFPGRHGAGGGA